MSGSSDLTSYLTSDAPGWLSELVGSLSPSQAENGVVVLVGELAPEAAESFEADVRAEASGSGGAEVAPIVFPIAVRVATNPAVINGVRTGAGWVLRGGAAAAGAAGWNKISSWF